MIATQYVNSEFETNDFVIGTTFKNKYFPLHIISKNSHSSRKYPMCENIIDNIYLYKKPANFISGRTSAFKQYGVLFSCLKSGAELRNYVFSFEDKDYILNCTKGYISDSKDNILLILTTNNFSVFDNNNNLDFNCLRLYLSNELITNKIYKNFYKKLNSEYVDYFYKNNIEVLFTSSEKIEKEIYSNDFEINFNSLEELNTILKSNILKDLEW